VSAGDSSACQKILFRPGAPGCLILDQLRTRRCLYS
jgi:hypothetical protein